MKRNHLIEIKYSEINCDSLSGPPPFCPATIPKHHRNHAETANPAIIRSKQVNLAGSLLGGWLAAAVLPAQPTLATRLQIAYSSFRTSAADRPPNIVNQKPVKRSAKIPAQFRLSSPSLGSRIIEGLEQAITWSQGQPANVQVTRLDIPEIDADQTQFGNPIMSWEQQDYDEAVAGISRGFRDVEAGRTRPAADFLADLRRKYDFQG
jgi:hypothetical protein